MLTISFQHGTLLLETGKETLPPGLETYCRYDERSSCYRSEALFYAPIITYLYRQQIPYRDQARAYQELSLTLHDPRPPRSYQLEALQRWRQVGRRGVVVLPTGTGKSFLAAQAIRQCSRSTLVVVPTLDLLAQWAEQLERTFACPIGMLGGGSQQLEEITVSTYDSAVLRMEFIGDRFGLLVVDECHHLTGAVYRQLARLCLAPFRLGLTATPAEAAPGEDNPLLELLGGICYRREIDELEGKVLAPYQTETIPVELDEDEQQQYDYHRNIYLQFLLQNRIRLNARQGWGMFLRACARNADGRTALKAYFTQRQIARSGRAKLRKIWELLQYHRGARVLIFTADNHTAYKIGEQFFLPVLTHHSKVNERRDMLSAFRRGDYPILVTSKVLNEGVDVPEANIGIVVSGSGSTREHVQRLGRILRPAPNKTAVLYELVSTGTSERYVSERRRQHRAYERPDSLPQQGQ